MNERPRFKTEFVFKKPCWFIHPIIKLLELKRKLRKHWWAMHGKLGEVMQIHHPALDPQLRDIIDDMDPRDDERIWEVEDW